jgi:hypothetical protein
MDKYKFIYKMCDLSECQIQELEEFILNHNPKPFAQAISISDLQYGRKMYIKYKTSPGPIYVIFGCSSITNYTWYKSPTGKTYAFEVSYQEPYNYDVVEDDQWFGRWAPM